jgi:6-phosphogluconolactonase (cycloisomerase 2 family)
MSKHFMISLLIQSALHITSRAFGATRFAGLLGLMGLLAACGGGGGGGSTTPPVVTLSSITVAPPSATVAAGLTLQFTATGVYSDGTQKDLSSTVTWTSGDTTKATVSPTTGLVTGVAAGTSTITATSGSVTGSDALTVTQPNLLSITVAPPSGTTAAVAAGLTLQFTATGVYSDGTQRDLSSTVTWKSSDQSKAIVSITTGLVTGVAAGTSTIIATFTSATAASVVGQDTLTVAPPNLLSVVISPNGPTIAVSKTVQFKAVASYTDGTTSPLAATWASSVPTIASIDSTTGLATGVLTGNTQISAIVATGQTITPVQMTVTAKIYAYATNFDDDTVSQYQLGSDGSLTAIAQPTVSTGHEPFSISVEPTGEYVYVSNWGSSNISQYKIQSNGSLMALGNGPVTSGHFPNAVTIDPNNKFAYVANLGDSTVSQYEIGLDGQLQPMGKPTVPSGANPASLIVTPNDKFAYVANFGINDVTPPPGPSTISQYSIGADGSLTELSSAAVSGSGPNAFAIDPSSAYLYVANQGDNNIGQYTINGNGTLSPMGPATVHSGMSTSTNTKPVGLTIDQAGHYLYVANQGDNSISQFTLGAGGDLSTVPPVTVAAGLGVSAVTIDPTGKYLYATNRGTTTISQFSIGTGGALTPLTVAAEVTSGLHPTAIAIGY